MAHDEHLAERIRLSLALHPSVEEKKMFGGLTFMVDGKMCVNVGRDRLMCRVDPARQDALLGRGDCRTVVMKGKELRGWLWVDEDSVRTKKELDDWIGLALDFNREAKSSKPGTISKKRS